MADRIPAPPAFYSRKRKRLHLLEDASPELDYITLPPINPPLQHQQHPPHHQHTLPSIRSSSPRSRSSSSDGHDSYRDHHGRRLSEHSSNHHIASTSTARPLHMSDAHNQNPSGSSSASNFAGLELPSGGLNRGFACLGCRKRKSKYVGWYF